MRSVKNVKPPETSSTLQARGLAGLHQLLRARD
jgi:hypothetical protein